MNEKRFSSSEELSKPSKSIPIATDQLKIGTTLANRYYIEGILGVGGMGAVYKARDLHFPNVVKQVAVKEMIIQTRDPLIRASIIRNFEREANLLATLDHPAIPRIFDYFTAHDRSYLVLELIHGKTLEDLIQQHIPIPQVIQWAIEICDVLSYLHNHKPEPIIFRDMKPSNVMINQYGRVMLIDFGIAKPFRGEQKGTMVGTEGYSPPEQYRGQASHLADIYALGATLHHFLTKRDPRLEAPFSFGERPICQINPEVPPELEAIIFKALQYDPKDRFQSAKEMKTALEAVLEKIAPPLSPPRLSTLPTSQEVKPIWVFSCQDEIRGSAAYRDGWLFFGSYDHRLYVVHATKGELIWNYQTDGPIVSRPLIEDGNVIFGCADCRLYALNQLSGKILWSYYTGGAIYSSPVFSGGHLFIGSDDAHLHAVNLASGNGVWKFDSGAPIRTTPCLYEDKLFFGNEYGDFLCIEFRGSLRWRFRAKRGITGSATIADHTIYFGSLDGAVYALDAKTGWQLWRFRLGKPTISTPCVSGEYLLVGCVDGHMYCIDIPSVKERWRFPTEHQVTGSAVVFEGRVYFGSVDGHLYCVDLQSGSLIWKFRTGGAITGTPLIANRCVFIGSTDRKMYALPLLP
ncbi:MAG: serine/threonine-protein kinase [Anaerolineales bacterium]|nr:serine/threonine-protein kinase [Anaerolineales bacterium]MDW8160715.1 serine/threonine-protein kinase [Anaerolineales bacterium]